HLLQASLIHHMDAISSHGQLASTRSRGAQNYSTATIPVATRYTPRAGAATPATVFTTRPKILDSFFSFGSSSRRTTRSSATPLVLSATGVIEEAVVAVF